MKNLKKNNWLVFVKSKKKVKCLKTKVKNLRKLRYKSSNKKNNKKTKGQ